MRSAEGRLASVMVGGVPLDLTTSSPPPSASFGGAFRDTLPADGSPVFQPTPSSPASRGGAALPGAVVPAMLGVATATEPPCMVKPAMVQPPAAAVLRRSSRHAVAADGSVATDEDSLAKAMRRKAMLNDQMTPGMSSKPKSFTSLSAHQLSSRLHKVGVTMGRNEEEVFVSANALKHMEFDRVKVYPNASSKPMSIPLEEDEATDNVDGQLLSHLVGEVSEVDLEGSGLGSIYDLHASGRKSRNASAKRIMKGRISP